MHLITDARNHYSALVGCRHLRDVIKSLTEEQSAHGTNKKQEHKDQGAELLDASDS